MERLTSIQTIEHADGSSHKQVYCFGHLWGPAFFKKGTNDYEEYLAIVKRLEEYETLEEQGKLLKLPVAVGDTVYVLQLDNSVYMMNNEKVWEIVEERFEIRHFDCIGKTVFLIREEAEAALKEMSKE